MDSSRLQSIMGITQIMKKNNQWEDYFAAQIIEIGLPEPIREHKFLDNRKFRFDFAWLPQKLAFEVDGAVFRRGGHTSGVGYSKDCEKYNLALIEGWRILRATTGQVSQGLAIEWLSQYFKKRVKLRRKVN